MKQQNPLAQHKTFFSKARAYIAARNSGAVAYTADLKTRPLKDVNFSDVEFIGGLWRVQNRMEYTLTTIRDRELVLGDRIDLQEKNYFEYYRAAIPPVYNCYGPISALKYDMVAAKYETDKGTYWAYGKSIAEARAFLGIRLYDEYMDLVHRVACKNTMRGRGK